MRRWRSDVRVVAVESDGFEKTRPRTFSLGESVCMGDSGGPAISAQGAVLGVYSTNSAGCSGSGARNFFTMLSGFGPLIREAYAAAGAEPWLEGQPPPGTVVDAGPTPSTELDAGLVLDDGSTDAPKDDPPDPRPSGKRVDSGFCSMSAPISTGGTAAALVLGAALAGFVARRRQA